MDLHNGLDIEVYDLRPTDLHYYYYLRVAVYKILKFCCFIQIYVLESCKVHYASWSASTC